MNWICKQKRWISIGCFLITCVFVVFGYQSGIFTDTQKMQAFLERAGVLAPLVFMAIQAVQVVIPILPVQSAVCSVSYFLAQSRVSFIITSESVSALWLPFYWREPADKIWCSK